MIVACETRYQALTDLLTNSETLMPIFGLMALVLLAFVSVVLAWKEH